MFTHFPYANLAASMLKCPRNHPLPLGKVKTSYQTPRAHPPSELALQPPSPIQGPPPASLNTHTLSCLSPFAHAVLSALLQLGNSYSSFKTSGYSSRSHHLFSTCYMPSPVPGTEEATANKTGRVLPSWSLHSRGGEPQAKQVRWSEAIGKKHKKGWGVAILDRAAREGSLRR